jgi:hypothetical protein
MKWIHIRARSFALIVTVALLPAASVVQASGSCIDFDASLRPGEVVELMATDQVWIDLEVSYDHVVRFTMSAIPETALEVWNLDYIEGENCFTEDEVLASEVGSESSVVLDWTDPTVTQDGVRIVLPPGAEPTTVIVGLEELAAPPADGVLIVPAVAHTIGVQGELFQSDLVVFNPIPVEVPATLVLVPTAGETGQREEITVAPLAMVSFDDIVANVFGLDDAVGALRVEYPRHQTLKVVSRTYALTDLGTYGQFVPALPFSDAATLGGRGAVRELPHLAKSGDFRSNLGFVEVLGLEADLDLEMVDKAGDVLASTSVIVPPFAHRQINDIFDYLGVDGDANAAVRLELKSHGRVFAYASVVDNHSSDPIFVPGLITGPSGWTPPDESSDLMVPAAASTGGAFGTRWQTDLRVVPSGTEIGELDVTFIPNDGSESVTGSFEFVGSGPLAVDDVVARIGASGAGHLWLHSPDGTMLATSRTYTVGDGGSYGQFIPACWSFEDLERGVVLGLKGNGEYRSNVGLVNPWDHPIVAELRLVSDAGEVLGSRVETVAANQGRQINDVFNFFGVAGCDLCRLEFDTETVIGRDDLYVWGSVIDNRTGDAVFVPPLPF